MMISRVLESRRVGRKTPHGTKHAPVIIWCLEDLSSVLDRGLADGLVNPIRALAMMQELIISCWGIPLEEAHQKL